jgi:NAD(P) transhydrogenase subunit alpha
LIIGVPRETFPGERRVALAPQSIPALQKAGFTVIVEANAGKEAGFLDGAYQEKGASVEPDRKALFARADIIVQVLCHGSNDITGEQDLPLLKKDQVLIGFLRPLGSRESVEKLAATGVNAFSVELMPRITRAQSMDVLSSMGTICGYKAVLLAADRLPRLFPMMTTAAGTITPARVLVVGVGVAGLQAIATARRLGAVVSAYDLRPAVREQVQSLGGRFVELAVEAKDAEDAGGYARAQSADFYARQQELLAQVVAGQDVVITAAVVPGKKPPVLVTADMVHRMAPGSVIVDLAAERGGNCEVTQAGREIFVNNVNIVGYINLASSVPYHASQMYAKNITNFLLHAFPNGKLVDTEQDEITGQTMLTRAGKLVNTRVREFHSIPG